MGVSGSESGAALHEGTTTADSIASNTDANFNCGTGWAHGTVMGLPIEELRKSIIPVEKPHHSIDEFIVLPERSFFRKAPTREEILRWSKHRIHRPITNVEPHSLANVALKCFRDLQRLMGDRKYGTRKHPRNPGPRALDFETMQRHLYIGLQQPTLRDELYLQVLKQVTDNPSWSSCLRGWEVMCVYSTTFPPSKHLIPVFLDLIQKYHQEPTLEERTTICAHFEEPTTDGKVFLSRIGLMERFIRTRIEKLAQTGPRGHLPTIEEITNIVAIPSRNQIFGVTLEEIMEYPENRDETGHYPKILAFLAESILKLKGTSLEGIFRVPGSIDEIQTLRLRIEKGDYSIDGITDPSVPASLLKLWFRELAQPIIPHEFYERCMLVGSDVDEAIAILDEIPETNRNVLKYLVKFLQVVGNPRFQPKTKMTIGNLAMVLAPNVLRCPSDNPLVILANSKFEQNFLKTLINYLVD